MIVHSDSTAGAMFTFIVMLGALGSLIASGAFFAAGEFRRALRVLAVCLVWVGTFVALTAAVSLVAPQIVVNIGDSYCEDIWCIGIDRVQAVHREQDVLYTLNVHIFSDADHAKTRANGAQLYLFDEQNRRFPLIPDPSAIPYNTTLDPGQTIRTTLTFIAPANSRHLYLWGDSTKVTPFWVAWYFGSVHNIFRKPTLIRVL